MNALSRGLAGLLLRRITGPREGPDRSVQPARFGIPVQDPACLERIRSVLTAFFSGFECGLKLPEGVPERAAGVDPVVRPFFQEGFAMGWLPRGYLELRSAARSLHAFEEAFDEGDPFLFLRYVGLGFWLGFQHPHAAERMGSMAARLRAKKLRHLVHDGYGFKAGFFGHQLLACGDLSPAAGLRRLGGFARASALNGLGRSLWFFSMDRPEDAFALARSFGPDRDAVLGGVGLAAAFTFPDDLSRAYRAASKLETEGRPHFLKGLRIALLVRARADLGLLRAWIGRLDPVLAARAAGDLERALKAERETMHKEDFIEEFHRACLGD